MIDDARRRQRLRRRRTAAACVLIGALVAGVAWASGGTARHSPVGGSVNAGATARASREATPAFNVRLVPRLNVVGVAGWCVVPEEHGRATGSACGGVPTSSQPFLQIFGSGRAGSSEQTQVAVTDPQITAVVVDGHRSVRDESAARSSLRATRGAPPHARRRQALGTRRARQASRTGVEPGAAPGERPSTGATPQRQPSGACGLSVSALPAITTRGGAVATTLRPFAGQLVGDAFLPCAESEFRLGREPLKAVVVLDAAQPGGPVARPSRSAPRSRGAGHLRRRRSDGEALRRCLARRRAGQRAGPANAAAAPPRRIGSPQQLTAGGHNLPAFTM